MGVPDRSSQDPPTRRRAGGGAATSSKQPRDKPADKALLPGEVRLRALVDNSTDLIAVLDAEARLVYVNLTAERFFGYSPAEQIGHNMFDLIHPEDVERVVASFSQALTTPGVNVPQSFRLAAADGRWRTVEAIGNNRLEDPAVRGIVINARDVTDRAEAERALRRRDAMLEAVAHIAKIILRESDWESHAEELLALFGEAAETSRAHIYQMSAAPDGSLLASVLYEWVAPGIPPTIEDPRLHDIPALAAGFVRWVEALSRGEIISGHVREFPESEWALLLGAQDIQSISVVPIFVEGKWWGFISLHQCLLEREWLPAEIEALRLAAETLGAAIWGTMTRQALKRRGAILGAAVSTSEILLRSGSWEDNLREVLANLGEAAGVRRVVAFEVDAGPRGHALAAPLSEWTRPGTAPLAVDAHLAASSLEEAGLGGWADLLERGEVVKGPLGEFPERQMRALQSLGGRSLAIVPVFAGSTWWGALALEDDRTHREWADMEIEALRVAAGALGAAVSRGRMEQALSDARERYQTLFENASEGIVHASVDGQIIEANPALARMLGYASPEELMTEVGNMRRIYLNPGRRDELLGLLAKKDSVRDFPIEVRRKDGSVRELSLGSRALRDGERRLVGLVSIVVDVTNARKAQEALRSAYEGERQAAERLHTLDELKNAFLQATSHELRTPLTAILGMSETLRRPDIDLSEGLSREMIERIGHNARRLDRLLADLLDVARLSRGTDQPHLVTADVTSLADNVIKNLDTSGHPLHLEGPHVEFPVDAPRLERIIDNLVANATKHTPVGTPIWVRLSHEADGLLIVVEDAGPGVPDEIKETVFEPFWQGPTTPAHAPGTGIGLSIVMQFTKLHSGRAWVEDRPGGGASFRVLLPERRKALRITAP